MRNNRFKSIFSVVLLSAFVAALSPCACIEGQIITPTSNNSKTNVDEHTCCESDQNKDSSSSSHQDDCSCSSCNTFIDTFATEASFKITGVYESSDSLNYLFPVRFIDHHFNNFNLFARGSPPTEISYHSITPLLSKLCRWLI